MSSSITIRRYSPSLHKEWDRFIGQSVNGTFLLNRSFMDYHADRFEDHSLMACNNNGVPIALLPACIQASSEGGILSSHPGLTYGGWIVGKNHSGPAVMIDIFRSLGDYMGEQGLTRLVYKPVPAVYHLYPSEDDIYALFLMGAQMTGCMVSSAIPLDQLPLMTGNNRRSSDKLLREGYRVSDLTDDKSLLEFWHLLDNRLSEAHKVRPVHSAAELSLLFHRFPDNIRLLSVRNLRGQIIAGTLVFFTRTVAHTQYIATSEEGRRLNCMTLIVRRLTEISHNLRVIRHIDFGVSCEDWGLTLNEGLASQKRNLGGRSNIYTRYEWDLRRKTASQCRTIIR